MKALLYHGLLIGIIFLVGGCVDPRSYMNLDVRLLADGYPPDYVEGYMAGFKSCWAEISPDKLNSSGDWVAEAKWKTADCFGQNLEVMVGQDSKGSKSYQQGRDDGKIAGQTSLLSYTRSMEEARQVREMARTYKPYTYPPYMQQVPGREEPSRTEKVFIYQDPLMLNQPFEDFNK
jgi:hypothetical protein